MRLAIYIFSFLFVVYAGKAQNNTFYSLNSDNGLSTNHVYCTLIDTLGYLWMGTSDGVYRYNGYSLRKYDYNDGLPNTDVWMLYMDKKNRIWLGSIAQNIGYIKNNEYVPVVKHKDNRMTQVYPDPMLSWGDTVAFSNRTYYTDLTYSYGVIYNDTLFEKRISNKLNMIPTNGYMNKGSYRVFKNYIMGVSDTTARMYDIQNLFNFSSVSPGKLLYEYKTTIPIHQLGVQYSVTSQIFERYILYFDRQSDHFNYYDLKKNRNHTVELGDEILSYVNYNQDNFYVLTNIGIHIYDTAFEQVAFYSFKPFETMPGFNGMNSFDYTLSDFWGSCISTSNLGLIIQKDEWNNKYTRHGNDLEQYNFINNKNDSVGYWWNTNTATLAEVHRGSIISKISLSKKFGDVHKVIGTFNNKKLLITRMSVSNMYKDGTISSITSNYSTCIRFSADSIVIDVIERKKTVFDLYFKGISDILQVDSNKYIFLGTSVVGSTFISFDDSNKTILSHDFDLERYEHVIIDSQTNSIICYATDKILVINNKQKYILYQKDINRLFGIYDVENISIDKYGHVLIKSSNTLLLIDRYKRTMYSILNNYNLSGSKIDLQGDILRVAGTFGVVQYKIHDDGSISETGNFPNTKSLTYKKLFDVQFSNGYVVLKTDNGIYTVNTSGGKNSTEKHNYKVVLNINEELSLINQYDTISIDQETNSIGIDVIKPTGTGELNIKYKFADSSFTSTGYNIIVPNLAPNNYYEVTLVANDATWQSGPVRFHVYITPYWWQTNTAIRIFFIVGILLLIGFVYLIIVLTRQIVNRSNEKRNQQRELELKSIYSQINPHFIFNTLSTAQYFVKKNKNQEAYDHITQFSDLLRSYIKSSRNKYITIAEETENLKNYLDLQLSRFENMFTYNVEIDERISPSSVKVPSLLLQPLIENALNHGIFHKEEPGHLQVVFTLDENNNLKCIVDDNGIGRKKAKEIGSERMKKVTSYGTILINELVETFNKYEKINISLKYIDKKLPETGTTVIITIKNHLYAT